MARVIEIADLGAPELDVFVRRTEAQLKNRLRPEDGLFIAESPKVIGYALDAGCEPVCLLMERRRLSFEALLARCGDAPAYVADEALLRQLTGYALTRGMLCAMRRPAPKSAEDVLRGARRVAVLEGVVDATNVGALFRSAAALGMDAVLLTPTSCDPLNRRALRVSMGTAFHVPWARFDGWPEAGLGILAKLGFRTVALALDPRAVPVDDPAIIGAEKLALVLGSEGDGLAPATLARCDATAIIPMAPGVDSLNVAAAGAVAFWVVRGR